MVASIPLFINSRITLSDMITCHFLTSLFFTLHALVLICITVRYLSWATVTLTSLLESIRVLDTVITILSPIPVDASIQKIGFCTSDYMLMTVVDVWQADVLWAY